MNNTNPIEDMIKKISELYHDQKDFRELKSNINNLLEQNYNWEKILEKLEIRYRDIIEQKIPEINTEDLEKIKKALEFIKS